MVLFASAAQAQSDDGVSDSSGYNAFRVGVESGIMPGLAAKTRSAGWWIGGSAILQFGRWGYGFRGALSGGDNLPTRQYSDSISYHSTYYEFGPSISYFPYIINRFCTYVTVSPCYAGREESTYDEDHNIRISGTRKLGFTMPVEVAAMYAPVPAFAIGVIAHGVVSKVSSFYGASFVVQLGWIPKWGRD